MNGKRMYISTILIMVLVTESLFSLSFPYNPDLSKVSDVSVALTMLSPSLLALKAPPSDYFTLGTSYAATMVGAYSVRTVLKQVINSPRPYVGTAEAPPPSSDDYNSFPSGHSMMAFSSAAYLQTMQHLWYPDSAPVKLACAASWTLAATTAVLRVVSGNHYVRDVLAGAAIGSAIGFLGPYLTDRLTHHDAKAPHVLVGSAIGMQLSW